MKFNRIRSLGSAGGHALATGLTMLWVGIVWRGISVESFPGNRDIVGHVRSSTEKIALGIPYDFKSALGLRLAYAADYLNPISLVQYLVGRENTLWAWFASLVLLVTIGLLTLARSVGFPSLIAQIGTVFVAVLSSYRRTQGWRHQNLAERNFYFSMRLCLLPGL